MLHSLEHVRDHQNSLTDTTALPSCQAPQLGCSRFAAKKVYRHRSSQTWYARLLTLPYLGITGSRYYGSPEISGHECRFDFGHIIGASYRAGEAGVQGTAQSERIRPWLVANRFQAISQASMMSARLINTVLASQWLRR